MCSIAGATDKISVKEMLSKMKHRAPDDSGIADDGKYAIGMGRLKILDLDSPNLCPIIDKNLVLTFNGELYNYQELKEELKKLGHEFYTTSDSEVLLKAYKEWGEDCLDKLNGMFAFAIYDGKQIFLARDIAGEKPLYYSKDDGVSFRFASEAKALDFKCDEFPPASRGVYDFATGNISIKTWWKPEKPEFSSFYEAVDTLDRLLEDSVRLRTRSDVPYALYFSRGIDSTLLSSYHDFKHKFTYEDGDYKDEFLKIFPTILYHLDYPIKSFTPFGLWKLAEQASKKVKVVLSGEGADELFGGYVRYVGNEFNRLAQERFPSYKALFPWRDMLTEEFNGNMRELLRMGDRCASAFGLENRCPFLDRRIIEFAQALPMEWKIKGYETKVILRELIKRRVPDYQFEEKAGLYCSVNDWLGAGDSFSKEKYWDYQMSLWKK